MVNYMQKSREITTGSILPISIGAMIRMPKCIGIRKSGRGGLRLPRLCLTLLMALTLLSVPASAEEHNVYNGPDMPFLEQDGEGAVPYGSHTVPSDYGVSTSNIALFGPMVSKFPYGTHYVYWRSGQYEYKLAYGRSLSYDGSRFLGDSVEIVTYRTNTGYGSQASLIHSTESNFALNPGNYVIWSDLGHYPTLYERGTLDYVHTAVLLLALFLVYSLFRNLWSSIRGKY